ncbi:hypothetical protein OIU84_028836 [Salix udensis]|uniref:Uncharacterized protein n=1 Tax=Salix udensis TaxID=889485 RepID=A0AAD6P9Y5_9ROSI|nr:hypothetical protein OIU84_028836 [Salix udensis]
MIDDKDLLNLERSRSSASDSSSRSSEEDFGSAQGPIFPTEVTSHNPVISTQVLPPPSLQRRVMGQPGAIYMGNGSFSRDHVFMLYKSGELPRFDETGNSSTSLSPVDEVENNGRENEDISMDIDVKGEESTDSEEEEPELTAEIRPTKDATERISCQEKMHPVEEVAEANNKLHFRLDATSGTTSSLNEVMRKHSSEKHLEQQSQPAETPGTTQKAAGNSWFACFSCCSLGC